MRTLSLIILFGALLHSPLTFASPSCFTAYSPWLQKDYRTCLSFTRPERAGEAGQPVVYFLHGIQGDAGSWVGSGYEAALEQWRSVAELPPITFVSMDTAGMSFFSDARGEPQGREAYETWLLNEFIPLIEKRFNVCSVPECRGIAGPSMGGYGALKIALRHPELFNMAAANSPALSPFGVYEPTSRWQQYFSRHPIGPLKGLALLHVVRRIFPTQELADQNDPAYLVERMSAKDLTLLPKLYFDMGDQDDYGFQEGYDRLLKLLNARGLNAQTALIPGGKHDVISSRAPYLLRFAFETLGQPSARHSGELTPVRSNLSGGVPSSKL